MVIVVELPIVCVGRNSVATSAADMNLNLRVIIKVPVQVSEGATIKDLIAIILVRSRVAGTYLPDGSGNKGAMSEKGIIDVEDGRVGGAPGKKSL